jgi:predicted O-linked N-acetylglucosamine transferase (SPINDLY family)
MGVPVVTRTGRSAASRGGLSIAANLGLPELVAHTDADFVRIAVDLARDLSRLAALRAGLRARLEASPLMDAPRFAANIENAYRQMWQAWCDAQEARRAARVSSPE